MVDAVLVREAIWYEDESPRTTEGARRYLVVPDGRLWIDPDRSGYLCRNGSIAVVEFRYDLILIDPDGGCFLSGARIVTLSDLGYYQKGAREWLRVEPRYVASILALHAAPEDCLRERPEGGCPVRLDGRAVHLLAGGCWIRQEGELSDGATETRMIRALVGSYPRRLGKDALKLAGVASPSATGGRIQRKFPGLIVKPGLSWRGYGLLVSETATNRHKISH